VGVIEAIRVECQAHRLAAERGGCIQGRPPGQAGGADRGQAGQGEGDVSLEGTLGETDRLGRSRDAERDVRRRAGARPTVFRTRQVGVFPADSPRVIAPHK
jgi:hypothetical protein